MDVDHAGADELDHDLGGTAFGDVDQAGEVGDAGLAVTFEVSEEATFSVANADGDGRRCRFCPARILVISLLAVTEFSP
ncbi:MAG: hypothetical protein IPH85_05580 [Ignavibacteria bacterium]|nr:hypothetical protein [Ignavibacteria bacterium]